MHTVHATTDDTGTSEHSDKGRYSGQAVKNVDDSRLPDNHADGSLSKTCMSAERKDATPKPSFYMRTLPNDLVDFSSLEGKARLARAIARGHAHSFFPLIAQFQTQPFPAACGLTTLTVILNALQVDPGVVWHQPWRWYSENFLYCCHDEAHIQSNGITVEEFSCTAGCNGLDTVIRRIISDAEARRLIVKSVSEESACNPLTVSAEDATTRTYRRSTPGTLLAISYSRQSLGQTGSGHFSPVAAYDEATDSVLILDTARFKYPPIWITLHNLNSATLPVDPATCLSRGYIECSRSSDACPNPPVRLKDALSRMERELHELSQTDLSASSIARIVNANIDISLRCRFLRCRSMVRVPNEAVDDLRSSPLHKEMDGITDTERDILALFYFGVLATMKKSGLETDAVAYLVLGCIWRDVSCNLQNAIATVKDSILATVNGFVADSVE